MSVPHRRVPIRTKFRIIEEYKKGMLPQQIATKFGVSKWIVYNVRRNEGAVLENYKSLKDPKNKEVEKALYKWFMAQREAHVNVRESNLMVKATELHQQIFDSRFHANKSWLADFKNRFEIRLDDKFVSRAQLIANFKLQLAKIMQDRQLSLDAVFTAEVSGLFWTSLPNCNFYADTTSAMPRERITFLVCLNVSATRKLKPFVVGKVRQPLSFRNQEVPIDYNYSESALIMGGTIVNWFFDKFIPQVEEFLLAQKLPLQAVLLLDKMPGYPSAEVLSRETADGEICVMYLPPSTEDTPYNTMDASTFTRLWYKKILLHKINSNICSVSSAFINMNLFDMALVLLLSWQKVPMAFLNKLYKRYYSDGTEFDEEDDTPLAELRNFEEVSIVSETLVAVNKLFGPRVYTKDDMWRWITVDRHWDCRSSAIDTTDSEDEYESLQHLQN